VPCVEDAEEQYMRRIGYVVCEKVSLKITC